MYGIIREFSRSEGIASRCVSASQSPREDLSLCGTAKICVGCPLSGVHPSDIEAVNQRLARLARSRIGCKICKDDQSRLGAERRWVPSHSENKPTEKHGLFVATRDKRRRRRSEQAEAHYRRRHENFDELRLRNAEERLTKEAEDGGSAASTTGIGVPLTGTRNEWRPRGIGKTMMRIETFHALMTRTFPPRCTDISADEARIRRRRAAERWRNRAEEHAPELLMHHGRNKSDQVKSKYPFAREPQAPPCSPSSPQKCAISVITVSDSDLESSDGQSGSIYEGEKLTSQSCRVRVMWATTLNSNGGGDSETAVRGRWYIQRRVICIN
ncbi:hypothetical protein B0H14DRAFT_2566285 [Mycena olivaceomarginata]|nr:hypothetical protein B0H14DRAFT_2566285 [Mycena olivaceomarginata]